MKKASVRSDNAFVSQRPQTIIWTYDSLVYWRIYVWIGLTDLTVSKVGNW